ncbi:hypothetical protein SAMN04515617_1432 [Collimonas sp. OK242]|uniref:hypothetical protein n=1 Tax=Collimonas sp. OK242 TaxID=1798195 RepID=UPI000894A1C4|nr:hypothetical protein [Collimonas sp. OK242]SDY98573.1 hypothetical protein SAMN04515617_1432 [Collimonas sp. OK242]
MKNNMFFSQTMKRMFLGMLASLTLLFACKAMAGADAAQGGSFDTDRFRGTGGVGDLVLDALSLKQGVTFYDDRGYVIDAPSSLSLKNNSQSAYPGGERGLPKTIRATWRVGDFRQKQGGGGWNGGTIVGDYTIPVAGRIPDEILNYIRKNGGALRIKLRLKDDGILLGWDVQRRVPIPGVDYKHCKDPRDCVYGLAYEMAGGDFREATIVNGKVVDPGW